MAMSEEHKAALAQGRREALVVRRYLESLGSKRSQTVRAPDQIRKRLKAVEAELEQTADVVRSLEMRQERIDLEQELERAKQAAGAEDVESQFVKVVQSFSERRGISYAAWRDAGVPSSVLRRAGVVPNPRASAKRTRSIA